MASGDERRGDAPTVSVCVITYNQEAFIAQAVESALTQQTSFPIEVVVGEDCSPDGTGDVLREWEARHPDRLRVLHHEKNLGASHNLEAALDACRGRYIALLDGDDYWTDPTKLERQVALLEAHPELSMCFHSVQRVWEDGSRPPSESWPPGRRDRYQLADMSEWIRIQPSSVVYRAEILPELPAWYHGAPTGDWPLCFLCAEHGDVGYLDRAMAVHRIHSGGIWFGARSDRSKALLAAVETEKLFMAHLGPERSPPFRRAMYRRFYDLAHWYADRGERALAWSYLRRCVREHALYDPRVARGEPLKILLRLLAPGVFHALRRGRASLRQEVGPAD